MLFWSPVALGVAFLAILVVLEPVVGYEYIVVLAAREASKWVGLQEVLGHNRYAVEEDADIPLAVKARSI